MHSPRYWAKSDVRAPAGRQVPWPTSCWRWSDVSFAEARQRADARAVELAELLESGAALWNRYGYLDGARIREEVTPVVVARDGDVETAVITRNVYGALVLNTSRAMFIDVDFAPTKPAEKLGGLFRGMLGGAKPKSPEEVGMTKISEWAAAQKDLGLRVYRTFAGLRCLVVNKIFDVAQPQTIAILESAGADPLYVRLCKAQACFRARLTPKPWRCNSVVPPTRYPWADGAAEARFRHWEKEYEQSIRGSRTVCRLIQQIGPDSVHPEVRADS